MGSDRPVEDKVRRDRPSRLPVIAGVGCVTFLLLAFGGCVALANTIGNFDLERERLDPIPVSTTACPYLAPVRDMSADLDRLWGSALRSDEQWPQVRDEMVSKLLAYELVLVAAEPHVPDRIRHELAIVVENVRAGRVTLPAAATFTVPEGLFAGLSSLQNASDLVGDACGPRVYDDIRLGTE